MIMTLGLSVPEVYLLLGGFFVLHGKRSTRRGVIDLLNRNGITERRGPNGVDS
jgi:hypothetical protein